MSEARRLKVLSDENAKLKMAEAMLGNAMLKDQPSSRLVVTYRQVGDLIPDPRNARAHPKRQIDQIHKSIGAFGFTNPILADPEGHNIAVTDGFRPPGPGRAE